MAQPQNPLCSPGADKLYTPRPRNSSVTSSSIALFEEQDQPTEKFSFTSFVESLAGQETITAVLSAGTSAQAFRWTTRTVANHTTPAGAHTSPLSSWLLEPPAERIDDLALVLRRGEAARAGRRRCCRRGRAAGGHCEQGKGTDAVVETTTTTTLDVLAPVFGLRRVSLSSLLGVQETIFHVRRQASGGRRAGWGELGGGSVPAASAVRFRADLPSERRRRAARGGRQAAGDVMGTRLSPCVG